MLSSVLLVSSITWYRSVRIEFFKIELFYYLSIRFFRMRVSNKKVEKKAKTRRSLYRSDQVKCVTYRY